MTTIVKKKLPNAVSHDDIQNVQLKQKIMLLMENIRSLQGQLETVQNAVIELQRAPKQKGIEDIERYVVEAAESAASASSSATSAGLSAASAGGSATSAGASATSAGGYAAAAEGHATSAGDSATEAGGYSASAAAAKTDAEGARDDAEGSAQAAEESAQRAEAAAALADRPVVVRFFGMDTAANVYRQFYLSDFVYDTVSAYDVTVKFYNEASTARTCVIWKNTASTVVADGVSVTVPVYDTVNKVPGIGSATGIEMTGDDYIRIDNIATTVGVVITLTKKVS